MSSSTSSPAQNFAGAATAATAAWTPTGGRTIHVRGPAAATGKYYLEAKYDPRTGIKKAQRVTITSSGSDYPGKPSFLGCLPQKTWSTPAAAAAAIEHFREWVDCGRRKQTAAAAAARAASKIVAPPIELALPERYSKRRAVGVKVNLSIGVISTAGGGTCTVALSTASFELSREEYNAAWDARSHRGALAWQHRQVLVAPREVLAALAHTQICAQDARLPPRLSRQPAELTG